MARRVLAGVGALGLVLLCACSPKTRVVPRELSLDTKATADPSGRVVLIASGYTCDDELDVETLVDDSSRTVIASGSGPVPDNDDGYCDRYIDTGGTGTELTTRSVHLDLDDGRWTIRSKHGRDSDFGQIEIVIDSGSIESSYPWKTLKQKADEEAAEAAMEPHRLATEAVAKAMSAAWFPTDPRDPVCRPASDPSVEVRYLTSCDLSVEVHSPDFYGRTSAEYGPGQTPMPPEVLEAVGCTAPKTAEPVDPYHPKRSTWLLNCDLGGDVAPGWTLEIRGEPDKNGNVNHDGWLWKEVEIQLRPPE